MAARDKSDTATVLRGVLMVFALVAAVWLLYMLRILVVDLLLALTLASALAPLAEWLEHRKCPRIVTVLGSYAGVALLYAAAAAFLAPALWDQAVQLYRHLPGYMAGVMDWYRELLDIAGHSGAAVPFGADDIRTVVLKLVEHTMDLTAGLVGLLLNGILVLFLTAYFVVEAPEIWPRVLRWVPPDRRERFGCLIRPLGSRMGGYVRGQLLVSLAVALFLSTGLTLLGVRYALVLGVLAGLLNLMPFVGSLMTATFSIIIASNQSLLLGGLTLGLFGLEQWFESNVIVPQLLGKQVELHPVLVLFAILTGATLMGVVGALVAVPVASAALFLAEEFYLKPMDDQAGAST